MDAENVTGYPIIRNIIAVSKKKLKEKVLRYDEVVCSDGQVFNDVLSRVSMGR